MASTLLQDAYRAVSKNPDLRLTIGREYLPNGVTWIRNLYGGGRAEILFDEELNIGLLKIAAMDSGFHVIDYHGLQGSNEGEGVIVYSKKPDISKPCPCCGYVEDGMIAVFRKDEKLTNVGGDFKLDDPKQLVVLDRYFELKGEKENKLVRIASKFNR